MKQIIINEKTAQQLMQDQFPIYKSLEISSVENQSHDHRTFRLGNDLLLRLPTAAHYAINIKKKLFGSLNLPLLLLQPSQHL